MPDVCHMMARFGMLPPPKYNSVFGAGRHHIKSHFILMKNYHEEIALGVQKFQIQMTRRDVLQVKLGDCEITTSSHHNACSRCRPSCINLPRRGWHSHCSPSRHSKMGGRSSCRTSKRGQRWPRAWPRHPSSSSRSPCCNNLPSRGWHSRCSPIRRSKMGCPSSCRTSRRDRLWPRLQAQRRRQLRERELRETSWFWFQYETASPC